LKARATIIVSGMIAGDPFQGGATWAVLQYVLGLAHLGHEVYLVEPIKRKALRPAGGDLGRSENAAYFDRVVAGFDLRQRAALILDDGQETVGLSRGELRRISQRADLLINISGMLTDESLLAPIPIRVYLDLDPAFNQLWSAVQGIDMRFAGHTHFATIGLAIGEPQCPVPTCGLPWIKTLQPVVLERWPKGGPIINDAFTTVGNWRGYGSIEYQGRLYGQKAHSLRPFFGLPKLTSERFVLALSIHPDEKSDLAGLKENGWELRDPLQLAGDPAQYQQFIQGSRAEIGIAKSGYVLSQCGWFSDRSVAYLASGRPVVAQETGFSRFLPTGAGLFSFTNQDEALASIEELRRDYANHSRRAREIAENSFDSNRVLSRFLANAGVG
jgi:hypothetical protein